MISDSLKILTLYRQFILWELRDGRKMPLNPLTLCPFEKGSDWQNDPSCMVDYNTAMLLADATRHIGFLFTASDPFFFVDIDDCLTPAGWSPLALEVLSMLPGAAVEVSQSGTGLHIIGSGKCPAHACKNIASGLELYTEGRFVALTDLNTIGHASLDMSAYLPALVNKYFTPRVAATGKEWTTEPCKEWAGSTDDAELIAKAMATQSAGGVFGSKCSFADLWGAKEAALAASYPATDGLRAYDGSSADMALAQHLAFWAGKNCERIKALMLKSALVREKWDREDYLYRTIVNACSLQTVVYSAGGSADNSIADKYGAGKLKASSDAQRAYAEKIRARVLRDANDAQGKLLCGNTVNAKFWLDNQDKTLDELCEMRTPVAAVSRVAINEPKIVAGYQYLSAALQIEFFKGCVYVQDQHRVFTPGGQLLKAEQFNATYGGYSFQLDETGDKTTRKAWEAFTESQVVRYPKASSTCFRPQLPTGTIIEEEGRAMVNSYVAINTRRLRGDVSPFLTHLAKILPDRQDQNILLAYMAACVQHKGVKFQWCPLLQGTEGNGKTLFTRCVAYAIGKRYTHCGG